jgi:hypothetical protein
MAWDDMMAGLPKRDPSDPGSAVTTVDGEAVSSPVRNVDADTLAVGNKRYRLEGFNAPETAKFQGGVFIPAQVAGDRTQELVNQAAHLGGYTELKDTGRRNNGRIVAKQVNAAGDTLGDALTALGITDVNAYSSLKAVGEKGVIQAMSRIMPSLANSDPMIRLAREEHEKRVVEQGGNPLFMPKLEMADEAQYAAVKTMVGTAAVAEQVKELERIEGYLADPSLTPSARKKLEGMLSDTKDKIFFAGTTPDVAGSVLNRQGDRTIMNQAHAQFSTSFDRAVMDMKKGFYGYAEMVGDGNGWEWLARKGRDGVLQQKVLAGSLPDTLGSIRDIKNNEDTWDTVTDAATYAGNLVAGTLPMLGMMAAATVGSGLVAGGGVAAMLSALPSALSYSGQFYADQPDNKKNSALALSAGVSSAVLDRVGLEGIIKGGNIFSQVGREEAVNAMVQSGKFATKELAEEALKGASKTAIMEMTGFGAEFAAKHYASKEAKLAAIRQIGVATAGETVTETGQTLLELLATSGEIDPDMRYEKGFNEALLDAAIGGGIMGGAMSAGGSAIDLAQWGSAADAKKVFEGQYNDQMAFQAHQKALAQAGVPDGNPQGVVSVLHALTKVNDHIENHSVPELQDLEGKPGDWNGFKSLVSDPMRFFRGLAGTTVKNLRKSNGELKFYLPVLKSIMAPGVLPGDAFDGFRQRIVGELVTKDADSLAADLKVPTGQVGPLLRSAWQTHWSKNQRLTGGTAMEIALQGWKDEADAAVDKTKQLLTELGYDTSSISSMDAVFTDAAIDPKTIVRNEPRVASALVDAGLNVRQAREVVQALVSGNPVQMSAAKDEMVRRGIFRDPSLNDLFEPNIINSFESFKHRLATQASKDIYLGKDGKMLAKLLYLAGQAGEFGSESEMKDTVQNVQDFYKIASGTYQSLENYPNVEKILNWGVTATMLASLGKAALSSIPEIAMATMGTPGDKVHTQLKGMVDNLFVELRNDINKGVSFGTSSIGISYARNTPNQRALKELEGLEAEAERLNTDPDTTAEALEAHSKKVKKFHKKYMGRSLFERLGFNDSGYNTQARFETNSANMKRTMQVFASMIGLRAMTDATRIGTLSMASDIVNGKLTSLKAIPTADRGRRFTSGVDMTNEQYQSLKELQGWGMDVEKTLSILDLLTESDPVKMDEVVFDIMSSKGYDSQKVIDTIDDSDPVAKDRAAEVVHAAVKQLEDEVMVTTRNMVNQRVMQPGVTNLPKYYHDPRLRVLTTMTRFVATMTANVLPRIYRDYIKDGSTGMRYQAFVTMAMAIVFAHMANQLKDVLAYGDDDNPYLKSNVKKAQRALYGSGLIGRGEALVDTFAPLYGFKKADPTEAPFTYAYQSVRNAAPPIGWSDRAVRAMYELGNGEAESGVKKLVKSLPLVGSFPVAATAAAELIKDK